MIEELAGLDQEYFSWGAAGECNELALNRREALVRELAVLCETNPAAAASSHSLFMEILERTVEIEGRIRRERGELRKALQQAETSLRQLGAFGEREATDASLLNRLA